MKHFNITGSNLEKHLAILKQKEETDRLDGIGIWSDYGHTIVINVDDDCQYQAKNDKFMLWLEGYCFAAELKLERRK